MTETETDKVMMRMAQIWELEKNISPGIMAKINLETEQIAIRQEAVQTARVNLDARYCFYAEDSWTALVLERVHTLQMNGVRSDADMVWFQKEISIIKEVEKQMSRCYSRRNIFERLGDANVFC